MDRVTIQINHCKCTPVKASVFRPGLRSIIGILVVALTAPLFAQITAPMSLILQAENFSAKQGGTFSATTDKDMAIAVRDLHNGMWLRFDNVNFLEGQYDTVTLSLWTWIQSSSAANVVQLRLDSQTATPVASVSGFRTTGQYGYQPSETIKAVLQRVTGVHTLFVTIQGFETSANNTLHLDWIRLSGSMTTTAADAQTYYVSVNGDDGNNGLTLDKPFRTIQKAASVMKPGSTCKIRQGIYRETVRPVYSGLAGAPLTFEAYNGEYAVISGADPITGWTPGGVAGKPAIYKASMRWTLGTYHNQLFVDGKMAWVARAPNMTDPYKPEPFYGAWGNLFDWGLQQTLTDPISVGTRVDSDNNGTDWGCNPSCDWPAGTSFQRGINDQWPSTNPIPRSLLNQPTDFFKGGLISMHVNYLSTGIITGSTSPSGTKTIITAKKTSSMMRNHGGPTYISHVFGLLDSPNEWFRQDSTLYLWAPDGGDPSHHLVEAKSRILAFDLRGGKQYINLTGLRVIGASVSLEDAANCVVDRCEFRNVSHYDTLAWWDMGVGYWQSGWNPADGHSGIYISGSNNIFKNSSILGAAGAGLVVAGLHNRVTNCVVNNCNYSETSQGAITIWRRNIYDPNDGRGMEIDHCSMQYNTRANIQVGAIWSPPTNTDPDRLKIHHNDFGASVYFCIEQGSLSGQNSNFVEASYNWFHGTAGPESGDITMEYDFGARHWVLHHNVFWQGSYAKGEIPIGPPFIRGQSFTFDWADTTSSTQVGAMCFNNTVVDSNWVLHRDRDLWVDANGLKAPFWRDPTHYNNNLWAKSDTAPWKFTNAVNRDFSLRAGSPAIDKGVVMPGWLTTYQGAAPDLGAYEYGEPRWTAGADFKPAQWWAWYPPPILPDAARLPGELTNRTFRPTLTMLPRGMKINTEISVACRIQVFDMQGILLIARDLPRGGATFIPTSAAAPGVYVARVQSRDYRASWKLLFR